MLKSARRVALQKNAPILVYHSIFGVPWQKLLGVHFPFIWCVFAVKPVSYWWFWMFYGQNQNIWTQMYSLYHAPIYPENTEMHCHKILKSYISTKGCFQHAKLLSIQILKLKENHMTKKCSSYLVPYTRYTPIYCKAHPFWLFSAWKTNPNP